MRYAQPRAPGRRHRSVLAGRVHVHQWWGGGVYALGTISALSNVVPCPPGSPSSMCGSTIYYVGIQTALAHYDTLFNSVSVATG